MIERAERVDDSIAPLDMSLCRRVEWNGNTYNGITYQVSNPATQQFTINTAQSTWDLDFSDLLPLGGYTRRTTAVQPDGAIKNGSNQTVNHAPYVNGQQTADQNHINLVWPLAVEGKVTVTTRIDNPN